MSVYLATQVTARIKTLLEQITRDNGSQTDIGARVYVNRLQTNEHEAGSCELLEGDETGQDREAGLLQTDIDYSISAWESRLETAIEDYTQDPHAEYVIQGAIIADIRSRLESKWCQLQDLGATLRYVGAERQPHQGAGELCGVTVRYAARFSAVDGNFYTVP